MGDDNEHVGLALAVLRSILVLDQADVARAAGVPASSISEYECGKTLPMPRTVDRLLHGMDLPPSTLDAALGLIRSVRSSRGTRASTVGEAAVRLGSATRDLAFAIASELFRPTTAIEGADATEESTSPSLLWERLRLHGTAERRAVVRECPAFWNAPFCALLCERSVKAAADNPEHAQELAELALDIASLIPGGAQRRSQVQGYAWAFFGNARRVRGDLPGADAAFVRSATMWGPGSPTGPEPLNLVRLLDLEASLRREQRRLGDALALLDRALALDEGRAAARLLVLKAKTLEEMDNYVGAVEALRQAAPYLDDEKDPRLLLCQRFNLLDNLLHTDRVAEAGPMLPGVRELAARLGNELDLVRLRWLEGRIAAGLGQPDEAVKAFRWVRDEFIARGIAYDAALVTLEAAVLLADTGRTLEVRRLASEAAPIFAAQGVGREALATLRLFRHAAEAETLTGALARQLLADLPRKNVSPVEAVG
jgi:transcriptional regulator with XRE-family HTH domain